MTSCAQRLRLHTSIPVGLALMALTVPTAALADASTAITTASLTPGQLTAPPIPKLKGRPAAAFTVTATLNGPASVVSGQRAHVTLTLTASSKSCSLIATHKRSKRNLGDVVPTRATTRWNWTVPANARSAFWNLTASCTISGVATTASTRLLVSGHGHVLALATQIKVQQSGAFFVTAIPTTVSH